MAKQFYARNRAEWRAWLEKNHDKESSVSLIKYKKHTGKPSLTHQESMDEAICYGWIDTTIKRLDDERYVRNFSKRNKNSKWSDATFSYAKRLIKEGRMTPAGLHAYKEGLKRPTHDHGIPKDPGMPAELKQALQKDLKAKECFNRLAPSYKRTYFRWVLKAKMQETRKKRIAQAIRMCKENKRLQ